MSVRAWTLSFTLALAAAACRKPDTGNQPAADTAAVRAEVDSVLGAHLSAFEQGDMVAWSSLFSPEVFFTAADPAEVFASRDSARETMQRAFAPVLAAGVKLAIRPVSHRIWLDSDGRTAAANYELDYTITYQNQGFPLRLRAAYLLERDSSGWKTVAAQYSQPISYDSLFMALVTRKVPGAARIGGQVPPAAGELATRFRADIRDIQKADIAPQAAIVTPGAVAADAEAGRRDLAQWLGPVGNATEPGDGMRGGLNPSGTVGWIATNLYVPIFAGPESAIAPMRALFVYHLAGNRWQLIQASLSVGLRARS